MCPDIPSLSTFSLPGCAVDHLLGSIHNNHSGKTSEVNCPSVSI